MTDTTAADLALAIGCADEIWSDNPHEPWEVGDVVAACLLMAQRLREADPVRAKVEAFRQTNAIFCGDASVDNWDNRQDAAHYLCAALGVDPEQLKEAL